VGREQQGTDTELTVRLDPWQVERLRRDGVAVEEVREQRALRKVGGRA
jgi:hypothetical protein